MSLRDKGRDIVFGRSIKEEFDLHLDLVNHTLDTESRWAIGQS
jgi:hypothetical protein